MKGPGGWQKSAGGEFGNRREIWWAIFSGGDCGSRSDQHAGEWLTTEGARGSRDTDRPDGPAPRVACHCQHAYGPTTYEGDAPSVTSRAKPVERQPGDPLRRQTYRQPGNRYAGTGGVLVFAVAAIRDVDGTARLLYALIALAMVWLGWTCRMTVTPDGLLVQNYGRTQVVPWREITAFHLARYRGSDVLHLELGARRTVRVWAVAVGIRSGSERFCQKVVTRLEQARAAAKRGA